MDDKPCGHISSGVKCFKCGEATQEHYVHELAELYYCSKCGSVAVYGPDGFTTYKVDKFEAEK